MMPADLQSFPYADLSSRISTHVAASAVNLKTRTCIIIDGPPRSGKSTLAKTFIARRVDTTLAFMPTQTEYPRSEAQMAKALKQGITAGYLWFDNPRGHIDSALLCRFLSAETWMSADEVKPSENNTLVIISGSGLQLTAALARHSIIIGLESMDGGRSITPLA